MNNLSRRNLLKTSVLSAGSFFIAGKAIANSCGITPAQAEGPFYPIADQFDKDNDLTQVRGTTQIAKGEIIIMSGIVTSEDCTPVEGALVEIWQACATGKYNHPGDPNPAQLDPNFQYWGRAVTNKKGEYRFKTIRPGHYRATSNWTRPAHIHLKVHKRGHEELTTQVYFKDDPFNAQDRILQSLSLAERNRVIVDFKKVPELKHKIGQFDISIKGII